MKDVTTIGIDLAKNVFHLHGINASGKEMFKKRVSRGKLMEFVVNLPKCAIAMEACSGANFWGRKFRDCGHEIKVMSPQYVKPYVKTNKNDWRDAEAIAEASTRPTMRFVPIKEVVHQDMQSLHRIRSHYLKQRIATSNHIRGLLGEYGEIIAQTLGAMLKEIPLILGNTENELSIPMKEEISTLYEHLIYLESKVSSLEKRIKKCAKDSEKCTRLMQLKGVGPHTATIMEATFSEPHLFKNGREASAYLGLVPKQNSTGGKDKLQGISKRGDRYVRYLLIHGARAALRVWSTQEIKTPIQKWALELLTRKSFNQVAVALANKNARIMWSLLSSNEGYESKEFKNAN